MKIAYLPRQRATKAPTQKLLDQADAIMQEYRSQGLDVTLRQLFYQFVSRGLLPNTQKAYKTLGDNVSEGRMHGDLDWDVLVDRGCELVSWAVESSPGDAIEELAASYRVDRWADQPYRVEVWIEKTALVGIVEKACSHQQVPYVAWVVRRARQWYGRLPSDSRIATTTRPTAIRARSSCTSATSIQLESVCRAASCTNSISSLSSTCSI